MRRIWKHLRWLTILIAFLVTALIGFIVWITQEDSLPQLINMALLLIPNG